jgi:hypothetical protein
METGNAQSHPYLTPGFPKVGYRPQVRRRRSFRQWWNWRVAGAVAIVVLAVFGVVGSITGYLNATHGYVRHHVFIAGEGKPVDARAAAGETIWVGVEATRLGAKWSTDTGISLHLSGRPDVLLHGPKRADWGDTVSTNTQQSDTFALGGEIQAPVTPGTYTGTIDGSVTGPKQVGMQDFKFRFQEETTALKVPVSITVLPPPSVSLWGRKAMVVATMWFCIGFTAAVGIFAMILGRRMVRKHWEGSASRSVFQSLGHALIPGIPMGLVLLLATGFTTKLGHVAPSGAPPLPVFSIVFYLTMTAAIFLAVFRGSTR